jgi:hypothetical protein
MVISDLYAAGCPDGRRLTEFPAEPDQAEVEYRMSRALPYLHQMRNTSSSWAVRIILRDLYQWEESITTENWRVLDDKIKERADDRVWHREILDRALVRRSVAEFARRREGLDDDRLQYALEWAFFTRTQWGEYDTAIYELERCWGRQPEPPTPIGSGEREQPQSRIRSLADVHDAVAYYVATIPYGSVVATATHFSTDIDYGVPSAQEMEEALHRRHSAGAAERDIYASYVNEIFLTELEEHSNELVLQFSLGAEPLPFETSSRLSQRTLAQLAEIIARHPRIRFQCLLASRHANQTLCTLVRELPNLSVAGYWWHAFFPATIGSIIDERLDALPTNKQIGFLSDAYCAEWTYAKAVIVRKQLAQSLAKRIESTQYSFDDAMGIARSILYDSPQSLLAMKPIEA